MRFEKFKFDKNILWVLFFGFVLRLLLSPKGTLSLDFNTFQAWSNILVEGGFQKFYYGWSDYLPGYLYVLWILGIIKANTFVIPTVVLYKLPSIIADVTAGYLIYKIILSQKKVWKSYALFAATIYIFNPAVFANSTFWGQVDSFTTLFSLLAVYLASKGSLGSSVAFSLGLLVKPQTALAAPALIYVALKDKWSKQKIFLSVVLASFVFLLGFFPFWDMQKPFLVFIHERILATLNQYPYTSINAFNFWGLFGLWQKEEPGQQLFGTVLTLSVVLAMYLRVRKIQSAQYYLLSAGMLGGYVFMSRLHERHLLPALAPLLATANPILILPFVLLSLIYAANLYYAYQWVTFEFKEVFTQIQIKIFSAITVFSLPLLLSVKLNAFIQKPKISLSLNLKALTQKSKKVSLSESLPVKKQRYLLVLILVFAFLSKILFVWDPPKEYFDEVYHAFTARVMLQGDKMAWEWENTPPEGYAYEWTHPPVAKEMMVLGMLIFGENSIGWRVPAAVFGTIATFLVYLLAVELFKNRDVGLLAGFIFSLDGLVLVMSRIGMNDIYFITFMLLSVYFFIKNKYLFSSISLGLSFATKWSTMWLIPVLLVGHFTFRKKTTLRYLWYVFIPPLIYVATYIPFFTTGHTWEQFINFETIRECLGKESCSLPYGLQQQMWWYHTNLNAEHGYSSSWWSWPLLIRPVWLFVGRPADGFIQNIYAMGNPVIFWGGIVALALLLSWAATEKNKILGFIVFAYLAFFASWAISPRIMFFYHYLPSVPFLTLGLAYALKRYPKAIVPSLVTMFIVFLYFYPHWTGITVPDWLDSSYYWLPSWK